MQLWTFLVSLWIWRVDIVLAARNGMQAFESVPSAPEGWVVEGAPSSDSRLQFRIALVPEKEDLLEQTIRQVSDPKSTRYGKYLTRSELHAIMKPSTAGEKAVRDWLNVSSILERNIKIDGNWISFSATTEQANAMLEAKFLTYRSIASGDIAIVRTREVFLPQNVIQYVQLVHPTTQFAQFQHHNNRIDSFQRVAANDTKVSCEKSTTPECLQDLYNIQGVTPDGDSGFIGVAGFLSEYPSRADLGIMLSKTALWAKGASYTSYSLKNGTLNEKKPTTEASLDIQYTVPLTFPMRNHFYSTGGRGGLVPDLNFPTQDSNLNEPFVDFFGHLLSQDDPKNIPHTISISYGDEEQTVPEKYARTVCDQIAALAVRGVSVVSGSGDFGTGSTCQTNDGKKTTRFLPFFPASCPWVTSVGGTTGYSPERAVSFSSGGFSDLWPRPWYQEEAVSKYLGELGSRWEGLYNPKGRGFPDISAQGTSFLVIRNGRQEAVGGTSASTPVIASIVALLNAQRLQDGKPTLGFLNPWLYSLKDKGITDIVAGGSRGCTGRGYSGGKTVFVPYASWNATEGWDPVTGVGTPLFDELLESLSTFDDVSQGLESDNSDARKVIF